MWNSGAKRLNFPTVLNQGDVGGQRQCLIHCHVISLALFSNGSKILVVDNTRLALRIIGFVARKCISGLQGCNSLPRFKYSAEQRMFVVQLFFRYGSAGKCRRNFLISADEWFHSVCTKGSKLSSCSVMAHGDAREEKWRGNKRMEWVTSKRHMTAGHRLARAVQTLQAADVHT